MIRIRGYPGDRDIWVACRSAGFEIGNFTEGAWTHGRHQADLSPGTLATEGIKSNIPIGCNRFHHHRSTITPLGRRRNNTDMNTSSRAQTASSSQPARVPRNPDVLVLCIVATTFAILTILGISGSSLSILSPDGSPDQAALLAGAPRPIRSDEYFVWSPTKLGQVYAGFPDERTFGMATIDLSDSWRHQVPVRSLGHAIYSPFNLPLLLLPARQGFAAYWWLPFAAALLGSYAWFRVMGARWRIALPTALLVITAPAAVWWSGWYLQGIAQSTATCALLIMATNRWAQKRRRAMVLALLAVVTALGLPWFYQPWAIVPALFTASVTAAWGLAQRDRRAAFLRTLSMFVLLMIVGTALFLWHEFDYYAALAGTEYPGHRRETGGGMTVGWIFSSLFAASVNGVDGSRLQNTNLSEFAMGWSIMLPLAVGVAVLARRALRDEVGSLVSRVALIVGSVLSTWAIIRWPSPLSRISLMTFVPPQRLAPFIGFFGLTSLVLLTGDADRWHRLRVDLDRGAALMLSAVALFFTMWAATEIRSYYIPSLSRPTIVSVAVVTVVLVYLLVSRQTVTALWGFAAIGALVAAFVNPLTIGTGAIHSSEAAGDIRRIDQETVSPVGGTWAADDLALVPLLNGVGVNALSSFNDPVNEAGWSILDPAGGYRNQWNRFGYIFFRWEPGLPDPVIENPSPDVVMVRIDPCDAALDELRLTMLVASTPIEGRCLSPESRFMWQGSERLVWRRAGDG